MMDDARVAEINDYLDGELPEADARALETWLEANPDGMELLADLRTLRSEADNLPRTRAPERDLWPDIQARLEGKTHAVRHPRIRRFVGDWLYRPAGLAAAALLLAIPALHFILGLPASVVNDDPESQALTEGLSRADRAYEEAREAVLSPLRGEETPVSPETLQIVEDNLARIDAAVTEIESALLETPDAPHLVKLLIATREREQSLLRQLGHLAREFRS